MFTLKELAALVHGTVLGDGDIVISGVSDIRNAKPGTLTFLDGTKYMEYSKSTEASAILTDKKSALNDSDGILVKDVRMSMAKILAQFNPQKKKTSYPIPGHRHLRKFIETSKVVFSDLSRRGMISSKESKTFDHHLRWIWTYYDELNSRWSNIRGGIKEDGLRQNILKVIGRWSSNLYDHMEFLDDTRSLIENLYHSGEMSEDDLEMVKTEIDQFQSIVLTLRKKVHDVKGY